ncbi:MAG: ATP-binding protein [Syntrophales bacterium]|jgi:adenylate kinase|nr:ATP-binding protein [Syntrophales bacterium]
MPPSPYKVIYLTGPPAVGKTTLVKRLQKACAELDIFVYSELLTQHLERTKKTNLSQKKLRMNSAHIVMPEDIEKVDQFLIDETNRLRSTRHIIIDSHPVTKEDYGFRITAFSIPLLLALKPTVICMLYADAGEIIKRIAKHPKGRPIANVYETSLHCSMQANVATIYGIQLGAPIYFFNASTAVDIDVAFNKIASWLS